MGRWSARLAPLLLDFAKVAEARRLLDVGCGTGTLTKAVRAQNPVAEVVGLDPAWEFIRHLHQEFAGDRAGFTWETRSACRTPIPSSMRRSASWCFRKWRRPSARLWKWRG